MFWRTQSHFICVSLRGNSNRFHKCLSTCVPQGLKPAFLYSLTARLKPCPSQNFGELRSLDSRGGCPYAHSSAISNSSSSHLRECCSQFLRGAKQRVLGR